MTEEPLCAVVLAGGASVRLDGRPKALLPIGPGGTPLIAEIVSRLEGVAAPVLVSARDPGAFSFLGKRVVVDPVPEGGPLAGLLAALEASPHERCLAVSCDAPSLEPRLLAHLAATAARTGASVVVPRAGGRLHPLHAVYRRALAPLLRERLARGERALHRLIAACGDALVVDEPELRRYDPDLGSLENVNTAEDLVRVVGPDRARAALEALGPGGVS